MIYAFAILIPFIVLYVVYSLIRIMFLTDRIKELEEQIDSMPDLHRAYK